jgi:hypothetical protein
LGRQLKYLPDRLQPLEFAAVLAEPQPYHAVVPVHPPGQTNLQQPKTFSAAMLAPKPPPHVAHRSTGMTRANLFLKVFLLWLSWEEYLTINS